MIERWLKKNEKTHKAFLGSNGFNNMSGIGSVAKIRDSTTNNVNCKKKTKIDF